MWIDAAASFQKCLAALPLTSYQTGETVLADGSRTDQLLIPGRRSASSGGLDRWVMNPARFWQISALLDCRNQKWRRTSNSYPTLQTQPHLAAYITQHGAPSALIELKRRLRTSHQQIGNNQENGKTAPAFNLGSIRNVRNPFIM